MFEKLKAYLGFDETVNPEVEIYVPEDEEAADNFDPGYDVTDEPESLPGHPAVNPFE